MLLGLNEGQIAARVLQGGKLNQRDILHGDGWSCQTMGSHGESPILP